MVHVKRPAGRKLYTPAEAWRNETFGADTGAFRAINALFSVLTESQQVRALGAMGWVVAKNPIPPKQGVAAQPEPVIVVKP